MLIRGTGLRQPRRQADGRRPTAVQRRRVRQPPPPSDAAPYDGFVVHPTGYGAHGTPCGARRTAGRRVGHLLPFLAEGASDGGSGMPGRRPSSARRLLGRLTETLLRSLAELANTHVLEPTEQRYQAQEARCSSAPPCRYQRRDSEDKQQCRSATQELQEAGSATGVFHETDTA